ncbi:MAG: alpha-hydroxy-acid oxidizing protein [Gammaproteobacteria bacterium]|nr:alpha-hydroxy-acid oxidizing protein [Gammaproteobacteria bacterium]
MKREHYAGRDFRRAVNIEDLRRIARRRLPAFSFEYVEGGSEDEVALRRNRDVFERITWLPRTLAGVGAPDLTTEIFGRTCHLPVIIAPTGFNGLLWPQGDLALARAAASAGIPFTLSTVSNYSLAKMKTEVDGQVWFQLYPVKDQKAIDRLVDMAREAGVETLVVTTDVPIFGAREWDLRNYSAPMQLRFSRKLDVLAHPRWLWQVMVPKGAPRFENLIEFLPPGVRSAMVGARYMGTQINAKLAWEDMERLRRRWPGKLVLKGVLCVEDARRAVEVGADGIVLSNHGGRQIDSCVSGVELLPAVASELGDRLTVLVDGGFRRGADVLKAMALGAHGVMIGRAALYGLAAGGEAGVSHGLTLLRTEMERVMLLLGCRTLGELGRHLIRS